MTSGKKSGANPPRKGNRSARSSQSIGKKRKDESFEEKKQEEERELTGSGRFSLSILSEKR